MDSWLANVYGTAGADDLEKTAQAHLLAKLAEQEGVDLSQLSDAELTALANEVLALNGMQPQGQPGLPQQGMPGMLPQQGMPGLPAAQPAPQLAAPQQTPGQLPPSQPQAPQAGAGEGDGMGELAKQAQAKFEEADLLGRVMAHAYTQEMDKIAASRAQEKTAGRFGATPMSHHVGGLHAGGTPKSLGEKARHLAMKAKMKGRAHLEDHKGTYAGGAAGAAAGAAAGHHKSKHASAFEKLAEMQAAEILGSAGFDPSTGQDMYAQQQDPSQGQAPDPGQVAQFNQQTPSAPQQPADQQQVTQQVTQQEQFQQALDNRSLEILQQAGYDVNEILARLSAAQGQA
jgi:hypothetical protein